jgi:hypothetical protein
MFVSSGLSIVSLLSSSIYLSFHHLFISHLIFYFKLHFLNNTVYNVKQCFRRPYIQYVGDSLILLITPPKLSSSSCHFHWSLLIGPQQALPPLQDGQLVVLATGNLQRVVV